MRQFSNYFIKSKQTIAIIQISMIVLSVVVLWISTYPFSQYHTIEMSNQLVNTNLTSRRVTSFRLIEARMHPVLIALEYITVAWFWIDITTRFLVSPDKVKSFFFFSSYSLYNNNNYLITDSLHATFRQCNRHRGHCTHVC